MKKGGRRALVVFGTILLTALAVFVVVLSQRETIPRGTIPNLVGSTLFCDDNLAVTVAPSPHAVRRDADYERRFKPVIESVRVLVDGRETDLQAKISSSLGKSGWYESAGFTVPADCRAVKAVLRVKYLDVTFRVTVPFERHATHVAKWYLLYDACTFEEVE